jgi:hypothetical protein
MLQFNFAQGTADGIVMHTNNIETVQKAQYDEIERYLDKQIAEVDRIRERSWQRDFSSLDAYEKSVEPWRGKPAELLGGLAYTNAPLNPKEELISEFPSHRAYRVWLRAFDDVSLYGIMLVPKKRRPTPGFDLHSWNGRNARGHLRVDRKAGLP